MYKIVHEAPARPAFLRPGIDPGLEEVVLKALANDPADRFPACRDMAKALEDSLVRPVTGAPATAACAAVAPPLHQAPLSPSVSGEFGAAPARARRPKALSARSITGIAATVVMLALIGIISLARRQAQVRPADQPQDKTKEVHTGQAVPAPAPAPVAPAPAAAAETRIPDGSIPLRLAVAARVSHRPSHRRAAAQFSCRRKWPWRDLSVIPGDT